MKKILLLSGLLLGTCAGPVWAETYYALNYYPYSPAAGAEGSSALHMWDSAFVAWADGYGNLQFGTGVTDFMLPEKALGAAVGGPYDVLCLGRGGQITLTFSGGIRDGAGADFAVFENGFNDSYLELAHVEVSSDGTNFVRFPNYSLTPNPTSQLDPTSVFGLAGTFRHDYGTPFDLNELRIAYLAALQGSTDFSAVYTAQLTNGFPLLDLEHITHVRLMDVFGDGLSAFDSRGLQVYDPVDPFGVSAGFDLDAVGVINRPVPDGLPQQIDFAPVPHQALAFGSWILEASADSSLPVFFTRQSGPATLDGNLLTFTGTGVVEVVATQPGDAAYAPAAPVLRSFRIAEQIQHIFVEPVSNQLQSGGSIQVKAYSSSGLPVLMEVYSGPNAVTIGPTNHVLDLASETGTVVLRAFQPGDASTTPAEEVFVDFEIIDAAAGRLPVVLAGWLTSNSVPEPAVSSGVDAYGRPAVVLDMTVDRWVLAGSSIAGSADLTVWSNSVPEILEIQADAEWIHLTVRMPADRARRFYRLILEGQ